MIHHTVHPLLGIVLHRFETDSGIVLVGVRPRGSAMASIDVYERDSALAARGLPDDVAHALPITLAARNRFGPRLIRTILRAVQRATPDVRRFVFEKKMGPNRGRRMERTV